MSIGRQRPLIRKMGTIDCDLVETNPVAFRGRLYRFEYVRPQYWANSTRDSYFRFVDHGSGELSAPFAVGYHMGCAFADGDAIYVSAVTRWDADRIVIFASRDLVSWERWDALDLPGWGLFNTSICRTDRGYLMMLEVGRPPSVCGVRFTARFAVSPDMRRWELAPADCAYARDRYTAPHCLRFLDGWHYNFYLEAADEYEQRVVRSRDLVRWEASPLNPVLRASPEDRRIANPPLPVALRERVASAVNINNSDIDFCEWDGGVIINYSWGNQLGIEHLAEARFDGGEADFLRAWFP